MTRRMFAERYGFSFDSITAIEQGKYRITREMAQRLSKATGVSSASLLMNQNPLRAWDGSIFNNKTGKPRNPVDEEGVSRMRFLLDSAVKASRQAKVRTRHADRSAEFEIMFQEWLARAMGDLDTEEPFWHLIFESWIDFEPTEKTLHQFNPNVIALSRTGKQLPVRSEKLKTYQRLWNSRSERIDTAKAEIVCEKLPKTSVTARQYVTDQSHDRPTGLAPEQVEPTLAQIGKAYELLAREHGVRHTPDDLSEVEKLIDRLARQRLAQSDRTQPS